MIILYKKSINYKGICFRKGHATEMEEPPRRLRQTHSHEDEQTQKIQTHKVLHLLQPDVLLEEGHQPESETEEVPLGVHLPRKYKTRRRRGGRTDARGPHRTGGARRQVGGGDAQLRRGGGRGVGDQRGTVAAKNRRERRSRQRRHGLFQVAVAHLADAQDGAEAEI